MKEGKGVVGMLRLWPIVKHRRWALAAIILLGILSSLFEGIGLSLFIPLLQNFSGAPPGAESGVLGRLSSLFVAVPEEGRLSAIILGIFLCILLKCAIQYLGSAISSWLSGDIGHWLRCRIFEQLLMLSQTYLENRQSSHLMNTLATETWRVCRALSVSAAILVNLCTIIVFVALLLLISWQLTAAVAVALGSIALIVQFAARRVRQIGDAAVAANQAFAQRMWEALGGMRVIRSFAQEPREQARFAAASETVRRTFLKMDLLGSLSSPLFEALATVLLLGLIAFASGNDRSALPSLAAFTLLLYRLQPQVRQLVANRIGLRSLVGAVDDVLRLLDHTDKSYLASGGVVLDGPDEKIEFRGVGFRYTPDDAWALHGVSFTIAPGGVTAIVGPSGAGKSTLVGLISRFFDPTEGEVRVGGRPLPDLDLPSWRRRIALVSQDVFLFSATVRENIAYGRPAASAAEVERAARLANAHDFIMALPLGYDTPLGERGTRLSGGQRQRLALARAVLCDPKVLILDEATSFLDGLSEDAVWQAIARFRQGRTVILITHRLTKVAGADRIIVLDRGTVVEQGDLETLLRHRSLFFHLYRSQRQRRPTADHREAV